MEMIMRSYPNDWVAKSIMYERGVGGGPSGVTHELTEAIQGTFHYTIGQEFGHSRSIHRSHADRGAACLRARQRASHRRGESRELDGYYASGRILGRLSHAGVDHARPTLRQEQKESRLWK